MEQMMGLKNHMINQLPELPKLSKVMKLPEIHLPELPEIHLPELPELPLPEALELPCLSQKIAIFNADEAKKLKRLPIVEQTWLETILTITSFLLFFGTFAMCPPIVLYSLFSAIMYRSTLAITILIIMITLAIFPRKLHTWPWFIKQPIWVMWRTYFNQSYVITAKIPKGRRYIFAEWPHGVFMMGQWLSQSVHGQIFEGTAYTKGAAADATLAFPLMRQIYSWYGCVSASHSSLIEETQRGYNLGICPGGIAEMFLSNADKDILFFEKRTGYIKLAIELGMDIIPVYHLGNTQGFIRAPLFDNFCAELSRRFRIGVFWPVGRFYLPIPQRFPIVSLVGSPVRINKGEATDEEVHRIQQDIKQQLQQLFNDYKHLVGWEDRELIFH